MGKADTLIVPQPASSMEGLATEKDNKVLLAHAFRKYFSNQKEQAEKFVDEFWTTATSADLDEAALNISETLINAEPINDPRWAEDRNTIGNVRTSSLMLQHQIKEKQIKYSAFLQFLQDFNIGQNVSCCSFELIAFSFLKPLHLKSKHTLKSWKRREG